MTAEPLATSTDLAAWQAGDDGTAVAAAQSAVRDHCQWHIAPVLEQTATLDTQPEVGTLWLPTLRLVSVTEVALTAADPADDLILAEGVDYTTGLGLGVVVGLVPLYWPRGFGAVRVTFEHGFDEVPPVVKAVVTAAAARAQANPAGLPNETVGPFSQSYGSNTDGSFGGVVLTNGEKNALAAYRIENRP